LLAVARVKAPAAAQAASGISEAGRVVIDAALPLAMEIVMLQNLRWVVPVMILTGLAGPVSADVITDWNEKTVAIVTTRAMLPPQAERVMAAVHVAMFDAVNSIEPRYRPYRLQFPAAKGTSKEAAAAAAAATVLAGLLPNAADEMKATLAAYLATMPPGIAKDDGMKLGEAIAAKIVAERSNDGSNAPDSYRPRTTPGVYIPTSITASSMWPNVTPFVMTSPTQFRPGAPIPINGAQWAADYNEIKMLGGKTSTARSAQQSEDGRFWLITGPQSYYPIVRQLVAAKKMSLIDSARFMALVSVATADSFIAVFDAKYHYEFWRPITAIRNGDTDDNPATERDAAWQPIDNTPMHPEYPCAHCITSAAVATVAETLLGSADVPELVMTSSTAPGVTHRWTNLWAYADEVSLARIWAGFHYRFSTRVGQDMGRKVGQFVVRSVMQPVNVAEAVPPR
jgi:PAP2 superfamily